VIDIASLPLFHWPINFITSNWRGMICAVRVLGQRRDMLGRLLNFLIYAIVILFVAWILTMILGVIPIIPGDIKGIVDLVIWAIAFIAILISAKYVFVDGGTPPIS
jgi:hypothetical protein